MEQVIVYHWTGFVVSSTMKLPRAWFTLPEPLAMSDNEDGSGWDWVNRINIAVSLSFILTTFVKVRCVNVGVKLPVLRSSPVISSLSFMSTSPSLAAIELPSTVKPVCSYAIWGTATDAS